MPEVIEGSGRENEAAQKTPWLKATVTSLANQRQSSTGPGGSMSPRPADLIEGIMQSLVKANNPNSPERISKAAFSFATKLMHQYNTFLTSLDVGDMAQANLGLLGGKSVVCLSSDREDLRVVNVEPFTKSLAIALGKFFYCDQYHESHQDQVKLIFYGVAQNTVRAAKAFERSINKIAEWSLECEDRSGRLSYCSGVADAMWSVSMGKIENEMDMATGADDSNESHFKWEDVEAIDLTTSASDAINILSQKQMIYSTRKFPLSAEQPRNPWRPLWKCETQLWKFRRNLHAVEENFVNQNSIKLPDRLRGDRNIMIPEAYRKGERQIEKMKLLVFY